MEITLVCNRKPFVFSGEAGDKYFQIWNKLGFYGGARDTVPFHLSLLRKDPICVDIGANIGLTTILTKAIAPEATIYAFEPDPKNFAHLKTVIEKNNFERCHAIQVACGISEHGTVRMYQSNGTSHIPAYHRDWGVEVPVTTIDAWAARAGVDRIDFLKIDVEGYEYKVLEGARETIAKYQPVSLIEFNHATTIMVGSMLPQDLLRTILDIYPIVDIVDIDTGFPIPLKRDEESFMRFIGDNMNKGFIHDLLCYFRPEQVAKSFRDTHHWMRTATPDVCKRCNCTSDSKEADEACRG